MYTQESLWNIVIVENRNFESITGMSERNYIHLRDGFRKPLKMMQFNRYRLSV
jgi:hypothetical protein